MSEYQAAYNQWVEYYKQLKKKYDELNGEIKILTENNQTYQTSKQQFEEYTTQLSYDIKLLQSEINKKNAIKAQENFINVVQNQSNREITPVATGSMSLTQVIELYKQFIKSSVLNYNSCENIYPTTTNLNDLIGKPNLAFMFLTKKGYVYGFYINGVLQNGQEYNDIRFFKLIGDVVKPTVELKQGKLLIQDENIITVENVLQLNGKQLSVDGKTEGVEKYEVIQFS